MKASLIAKGIIKAVAFYIGVALTVYILYEIRILIVYIIAALVLALLGRPLVRMLKTRFNISKTAGAVIALLLIFGLFLGLIAIFIPMLSEQGKNLALFNFDNIQNELDEMYTAISNYFGTTKEAVEELVKDSQIEKKATEELGDNSVPSILDTVLGVLTQLSVGLFSIFFMAFFILKDHNSLHRFLMAMLRPEHRARATGSLGKIKNLLSSYFIGLLFQILILFVIYSITLIAVGTKQAFVVAFFCALFNIVPYVGPLIGAILMLVFTITSHMDMNFSNEVLPLVGYVMLGVTVGQLIDNFVSQPYIYSNSIKSHPLEIFVIIIGAGLLFGIVGMLIAVPTYAVLKVVLKEFFWDNSFVRAWTKGI